MNKKFFLWQLKQWVPVLAIFAVFLSGMFLSTCLTSNVYATQYSNPYYPETIGMYPENNLLSIAIPAMVLTFVMPCFVYHYRFVRSSADFYRQAPEKEGAIRRTKVLLGLLIILVCTTVVFFLGLLLMLVRFATAPDPATIYGDSTNYVQYNLYFGYYPLFLLFLLIGLSAQYLINCFIMGLAGTMLDGIFLMLAAQIFLNGLFEFPLLMLLFWNGSLRGALESFLSQTGILFPGYGAVEPVLFSYRFFEPLIAKNSFTMVFEEAYLNVFNYLTIGLYLALGGTCGFLVMRGKDPSGEFFGKPGPRNQLARMPIYLAGISLAPLLAALADVGFSAGGTLLILLMFFNMWAVGFYAILAIYHRSFRIGKESLTVYLCSAGFCVALMVISLIVGV